MTLGPLPQGDVLYSSPLAPNPRRVRLFLAELGWEGKLSVVDVDGIARSCDRVDNGDGLVAASAVVVGAAFEHGDSINRIGNGDDFYSGNFEPHRI